MKNLNPIARIKCYRGWNEIRIRTFYFETTIQLQFYIFFYKIKFNQELSIFQKKKAFAPINIFVI